jgi:hypothetical protein
MGLADQRIADAHQQRGKKPCQHPQAQGSVLALQKHGLDNRFM